MANNPGGVFGLIMYAGSVLTGIGILVVLGIGLYRGGKELWDKDPAIRKEARSQFSGTISTLLMIFGMLFIFLQILEYIVSGSSVLTRLADLVISIFDFLTDIFHQGMNPPQ